MSSQEWTEWLQFHLCEKEYQLKENIPLLKKLLEDLKKSNNSKQTRKCNKLISLFEKYQLLVQEYISTHSHLFIKREMFEFVTGKTTFFQFHHKKQEIWMEFKNQMMNYCVVHLFPFVRIQLMRRAGGS
jgi:hypothetical protein